MVNRVYEAERHADQRQAIACLRRQLGVYRLLALKRGGYVRCVHESLRWSKISCFVCFVIGLCVGACAMAAAWAMPF